MIWEKMCCINWLHGYIQPSNLSSALKCPYKDELLSTVLLCINFQLQTNLQS